MARQKIYLSSYRKHAQIHSDHSYASVWASLCLDKQLTHWKRLYSTLHCQLGDVGRPLLFKQCYIRWTHLCHIKMVKKNIYTHMKLTSIFHASCMCMHWGCYGVPPQPYFPFAMKEENEEHTNHSFKFPPNHIIIRIWRQSRSKRPNGLPCVSLSNCRGVWKTP